MKAIRNAYNFNISIWEKNIEEKNKEKEKNRLKILENSIRILKDYFKDKNVINAFLAGSILKENKFYQFSDIDIVVKGLKEDYFKTKSELENLLDRDVDIIEIEESKFGDSILKNGIQIK
ncbi:MAG: hypothetical protein HY934_10900 [Candidatus Firestonebacteria bacterium]|nr:hypothetical protein [Candidatus Firestonebacteria bacterium]